MKKILAAVSVLGLLAILPSAAIAQAAPDAAPAVPAANAPTSAPVQDIQNRVGIAAVVNEDVITFSDINARVVLMLLGTPGAPPPEVRREIEARTLSKLIDEKLEMQEAKSLDIIVTDDQVQEGFTQIAQQNNMAVDEFKKRLIEQGLQIETLYDQIRAEIAWSQVARRKLRPQINISESDIDSEIIAMKNRPPEPAPAAVGPGGGPITATAETGPLVHLKQLVILFEKTDTKDIINAKIQRVAAMKAEIKNCADMDAKMQQFKNHGTNDLGTGPLNGLPPPLKKAVENLKIGELSNPVRGGNGVAVLMVCERIEPGQTAQAAAPAPAAPAPAAPAAPAETPAPAAQTNAGAGAEAGAENAAVSPEAASATASEAQRDDVANKLGLKRLLQMQERYLRDLRATAFIDKRI